MLLTSRRKGQRGMVPMMVSMLPYSLSMVPMMDREFPITSRSLLTPPYSRNGDRTQRRVLLRGQRRPKAPKSEPKQESMRASVKCYRSWWRPAA